MLSFGSNCHQTIFEPFRYLLKQILKVKGVYSLMLFRNILTFSVQLLVGYFFLMAYEGDFRLKWLSFVLSAFSNYILNYCRTQSNCWKKVLKSKETDARKSSSKIWPSLQYVSRFWDVYFCVKGQLTKWNSSAWHGTVVKESKTPPVAQTRLAVTYKKPKYYLVLFS